MIIGTTTTRWLYVHTTTFWLCCQAQKYNYIVVCLIAQFKGVLFMTIEQIRLKETRERKQMTQSEVANILGITQQAYQKLETGKTADMRISTVKKICKIFDISADWLLGLKE